MTPKTSTPAAQGTVAGDQTDRYHKRPFSGFAPRDEKRRKQIVSLPMDVLLAIIRERLEYLQHGSDLDAVTQQAACEIERAMGVFPNLEGSASPPPPTEALPASGVEAVPEKRKKPLTEKQLHNMPGDKKPYYIWDTQGARLFYDQTEEVKKAWNDYARREADKVTDPGIVDWSPALAHNWTPPLSIKQWIAALSPTEAPAPSAAERIADAVLSWMVKFDLLDAGNEYDASDVLAVLDDLAPAPATGGVRVKELEWRDGRDAGTVFSVVQIATILGADELVGLEYTVLGPNRHGLYETVLGAKIIKTSGSEGEAKAAAQADYEARIRAALATDASPSGGKSAPDDDYHRPDASGYSRADEEWFFDMDGKP
jgi:hypothetical protein